MKSASLIAVRYRERLSGSETMTKSVYTALDIDDRTMWLHEELFHVLSECCKMLSIAILGLLDWNFRTTLETLLNLAMQPPAKRAKKEEGNAGAGECVAVHAYLDGLGVPPVPESHRPWKVHFQQLLQPVVEVAPPVARASQVWPLNAPHPALARVGDRRDSAAAVTRQRMELAPQEIGVPSFPLYDEESGMERYLSEVGKWGEQYVFDLLTQRFSPGGDTVHWANEAVESYLPYDLTVTTSAGETTYVEVKTTTRNSKRRFHVSPDEIVFAREHGVSYKIYCVLVEQPSRPEIIEVSDVRGALSRGAADLLIELREFDT